MRKRTGNSYDIDLYEPQGGDLLKTIKFNAYNLQSIKQNLPKSSYGQNQEQDQSKEKQRKDSLDSLDYGRKERVMSACGIRRDRTGN